MSGALGDGAEYRLSWNGSIGLSTSSSTPSRLGAVAARGISITVPAKSGGKGNLLSMRLKTFIEDFRGIFDFLSFGLRMTLRSDSLSSAALLGLDCWLPMTAGLFGSFFGRFCATCVIVSQSVVSHAVRILYFKSSRGIVVRPLLLVRSSVHGRLLRSIRKRGEHAAFVDV